MVPTLILYRIRLLYQDSVLNVFPQGQEMLGRTIVVLLPDEEQLVVPC